VGALKDSFDKSEEDYKSLERAYVELKDRYDQLCGKLRKNANESRGDGNHFLSSYAKDRRGPWE